MRTYFLSALLVTGVANAAEPTPEVQPLEITDARNKAAEHAFTQGLLHTKVSEKCQKLPEPIRSRARTALEEWRGRNQYLVNPAFLWVNYVGAATTRDKGAAQNYVYITLTAFNTAAEATVRETLPGRKPSLEACESWLAKFADESLDLNVSHHAASLQELREYSNRFSVPNAGR